MIVCAIPARYNSSRFPGKLLAEAAGKTILRRTYECALGSKRFDELFIATDDERIANHAHSFGATVVWTSPGCLNGTDRIREMVQKTPRLKGAEIILNLQGDHPLTSPSTLDAIVDKLLEDPKAPVATAVKKIVCKEDFLSPHVVKCVMDQRGRALYFSRAPIPYSASQDFFGYQHIGLYAYRTSFLMKIGSLANTDLQLREDLEQLKFLELGYRISVALVEDEAIGIDTPQDLDKLKERLACRQNIFSSPAEWSLPLAKG